MLCFVVTVVGYVLHSREIAHKRIHSDYYTKLWGCVSFSLRICFCVIKLHLDNVIIGDLQHCLSNPKDLKL